MNELELLVELVKRLRFWTIVGDILVPVVLSIAFLITYIHQKNRIKNLKEAVQLWNPKDVKEKAEAYKYLMESQMKMALDDIGKKMKSAIREKESIQSTFEQTKSKISKNEKAKLIAEMNCRILTVALLQAISIGMRIRSIAIVKDSLLFYYVLNLEKKYPEAPKLQTLRNKLKIPEKRYGEYFEYFENQYSSEIPLNEEIPEPRQLANFLQDVDSLDLIIDEVFSTSAAYIERHIEERKQKASNAAPP